MGILQEIVSKLPVKVSIEFLLSICLATLTIFFISMFERNFLDDYLQNENQFLFIIPLSVFSFLFYLIINPIGLLLYPNAGFKNLRCNNLTDDERKILFHFYDNQFPSLFLDKKNKSVESLINRKFLRSGFEYDLYNQNVKEYRVSDEGKKKCDQFLFNRLKLRRFKEEDVNALMSKIIKTPQTTTNHIEESNKRSQRYREGY